VSECTFAPLPYVAMDIMEAQFGGFEHIYRRTTSIHQLNVCMLFDLVVNYILFHSLFEFGGIEVSLVTTKKE